MKINIKVIAEKAGVSTATVSRVLNDYEGVRDNTRKKVLKIIDKYDYEINAVAKSLKQRKTMTIGIVIGNVLSQFYSIIDLLKTDSETIKKSILKRFFLNKIRYNSWFRALALFQFGNSIFMLKRNF